MFKRPKRIEGLPKELTLSQASKIFSIPESKLLELSVSGKIEGQEISEEENSRLNGLLNN